MSEATSAIQKNFYPPSWTLIYTGGISLLGLIIVIDALFHLPADLLGLLIFASLCAIAELGSVELYISSRQSRVSVSSIIAIAGILLFGPLAGALIHMVGGIMTLVTTTLINPHPEKGRASWLHRSAFNSAMLVIAAFIAGHVYLFTGGAPGYVPRWGNLIPIVAATAVDTLINLIILIGVIHLQTMRPVLQIWRQDFQWAIPIAIVGGLLGGSILALAYQMFNLLGLVVFFLPVLSTSYSIRLYTNKTREYVNQLERSKQELEHTNHELERANQEQRQLNQELGYANNRLKNHNYELLEILGAFVDAYDLYTHGHSIKVADYAKALAEILGLPAETQALIEKAALVHDIGKVSVKDSIIGKEGALSEKEYNWVKQHPAIGADILQRSEGLQDIVPLVRHHHERWDGKGYPNGLAGEEISLPTRILTLADALDSMRSDRSYRSGLTLEEATEEIRRCSGTQFDPQVVEAFLVLVEEKDIHFFSNSAHTVDQALMQNGTKPDYMGKTRFMKKSMME